MAWISLTQRNKQKRILHFSINLLRSPMGNENSYFEAIPWIVLLNNWIWPNVLKRYTSIKFIRYSKSFIGSMGNLMLLSNTIWYWKLYYSYFCNTNKLLDYTVGAIILLVLKLAIHLVCCFYCFYIGNVYARSFKACLFLIKLWAYFHLQ